MRLLTLAILPYLFESLHAQLHPNFFEPVTRPDIQAPKWNIEIYDQEALAPEGYWFVCPYESLLQHSWPLWNGPHIYDTSGELVWSGAPFVKYYNTFDFRMSRYNGEKVLTFIWPKNSEQQEGGFIMNDRYEVIKVLDMRGEHQRRPNMHDLNLIDDGKRALMLTTPYQNESHVVIPGEFDGQCKVDRQGFKELDVETGETLFSWNSRYHIGVDETTYFPGESRTAATFRQMCDTYWDITHLNAISKFDDGDYLLSARHTNTLYKISHKTGDIVWRLGGVKSDFTFPDSRTIFARQHHARFRSQNSTHTIVSLFDNAVGDYPSKASSFESWGLVLALHTSETPMTVSLVSRFQKPFTSMKDSHPLEKARGTVEYLHNGNVFVGWVIGSQISEHAADGRMLMHAEFKIPEAASYRAYKMDWRGRPSATPDVVADVTSPDPNSPSSSNMKTTVHMSWNGDTRTKTWNILHTSASGSSSELVASTPRTGFETKVEVEGYMRHLVAVALDTNGAELGRSAVITIRLPPELQIPAIAAAEEDWLKTHEHDSWQADAIAPMDTGSHNAHAGDNGQWKTFTGDGSWVFSGFAFFGIVLAVVLFLLFRRRRQQWWNSRDPVKYETLHVLGSDEELERFDDHTLRKEGSGGGGKERVS